MLTVLVPSVSISWVAVAWVRRAALRLGLLDRPGARKVHTTPIPLGGGIGIWTGVVGTLAAGSLAVDRSDDTRTGLVVTPGDYRTL